MKHHRNHERKTLLLSVLVSFGFLVSFMLANMAREPLMIVQTTALEPIEWESEKWSLSTDYPLWFKNPNETYVENSYVSDSASIVFTAEPLKLLADFWEYDYSCVLCLKASLSIQVSTGFVENIRIFFRENSISNVLLRAMEVPSWLKSENLTITNFACLFYREWLLKENVKAFLEADDVVHSEGALLEVDAIDWILNVSYRTTQQLEITAEVTYFNGTSYVKVVLPVFIKLIGDIGNTFETARNITAGTYRGYLSVIDGSDPADYYEIWLSKGQEIRVNAALRLVDLVNVTLYDPEHVPRACISTGEFIGAETQFTEELTYTADTDGHWYVGLSTGNDNGIYLLSIKVD